MALDLPLVVIEQDRRRAEELRAQGIPVVNGDATSPGVLAHAGAARAQVLVLAAPEGFQTPRILELARELNPGIDIAVRATSESEVAQLERQGVGIAIMGEREVAFGLMDYALRRLGIPEAATQLFIQHHARHGRGRRVRSAARGA